MKRIALVGHRGVGKTSLLARYRSQGFSVFDLDAEIESRVGQTVSEIFHSKGEAAFRELEKSTFEMITTTNDRKPSKDSPLADSKGFVVALGAGFSVEAIGSNWHVIWVRRASDEAGRIFTDRPRLDANVSALDEFFSRARAREPGYAARAHAVLILDEGIEETNDPAEQNYINDHIDLAGATLTITKWPRNFKKWIEQRLTWNLKYFELRDDLLTEEQIAEALGEIPRDKILFSFREATRTKQSILQLKSQDQSTNSNFSVATDWSFELGKPNFVPTYLSIHTGNLTDFDQAANANVNLNLNVNVNLNVVGNINGNRNVQTSLKAALRTNSFQDLLVGHHWQQKDPLNRVFLPMSQDGRWSWYRSLRRDYSLNFIRESEGSASDQPTLLQWMRNPTSQNFAAVLGDPVKHSRTPMEQREFFANKGQAVHAIRISEEEWPEAIAALTELGLTNAAVTAPLKNKAAQLINSPTPINTLHFPNINLNTNTNANMNANVSGTNTDLAGLEVAAKQLPPTQTQVVWGGGGTLDVIKKVFPKAQLVSVRTGLVRETNQLPNAPDLIIWAANLKHCAQNPPSEWKPKFVFDLNYSEASPARDYAMKTGAKYISGLAMFRAQAQSQREFWDQFKEHP